METTSDILKTAISLKQVGQLVDERAVYAIFDSVGAPRVPEKMHALAAERALSLFLGTPFESYTAVAPYLASLDPELLDWTRRELWQEPWGILVFSRTPLVELFHHFRRFLTARMPDGNSVFFRFQDPRILLAFLRSAEATSFGFWNGVAAYGWSDGESVVMVKCPRGIAQNQPSQQGNLAFSNELMSSLGKTQLQNFTDRCTKYFEMTGISLPAERDAFFQSILKYGSSVGIKLEIDLLRFMQLVLGWKGMQSIAVVREILSYPAVSGTDKVDLLCEMAAFGGFASSPADAPGLDRSAHRQALTEFLRKHQNDAQFLRVHPDGILTTQPADTRWRKEWMQLYCEKVASLAQVTNVPVGSVVVG
jgi:hypothetical protein